MATVEILAYGGDSIGEEELVSFFHKFDWVSMVERILVLWWSEVSTEFAEVDLVDGEAVVEVATPAATAGVP